MVIGRMSWEMLAHEAQELFERELDRRGVSYDADGTRRGSQERVAADRSPLDDRIVRPDAAPVQDRQSLRGDGASHWLVPELAHLLAENRDRPTAELELAIRELITERQFIATAGDPVPAHRDHQQQEQFVRDHLAIALRVHRQLRQRTRSNGAWADVPTPPQMFG